MLLFSSSVDGRLLIYTPGCSAQPFLASNTRMADYTVAVIGDCTPQEEPQGCRCGRRWETW